MSARAYLDHASSSPLRPEALDAMLPYLSQHHADPGRLHQEALTTRAAIETAREEVAEFLGARPREVVFCSSGTEAINAAHWWAGDHIVMSAVEHAAVREAVARCAAEVSVIGVDHAGRVNASEVIAAVRAETSLVTIQLANHEVGTIQPVAEIASALRDHPAKVHVDACAAIGYHPISFRDLDIDLLSATAHKFGGPAGAAALFVRRGLRLPVLIVGGAQERARRGGTENTPAIVGFGAACTAVGANLDAEIQRQRAFTQQAWDGISAIPRLQRHTPELQPSARTEPAALPHVLCISVSDIEAEPILLALDQRGVAIHSGSACSSESWEPSPVLAAMHADAQHSLRISVGWPTTIADIEHFISAFHSAIEQLGALRSR